MSPDQRATLIKKITKRKKRAMEVESNVSGKKLEGKLLIQESQI